MKSLLLSLKIVRILFYVNAGMVLGSAVFFGPKQVGYFFGMTIYCFVCQLILRLAIKAQNP